MRASSDSSNGARPPSLRLLLIGAGGKRKGPSRNPPVPEAVVSKWAPGPLAHDTLRYRRVS